MTINDNFHLFSSFNYFFLLLYTLHGEKLVGVYFSQCFWIILWKNVHFVLFGIYLDIHCIGKCLGLEVSLYNDNLPLVISAFGHPENFMNESLKKRSVSCTGIYLGIKLGAQIVSVRLILEYKGNICKEPPLNDLKPSTCANLGITLLPNFTG